MNGTIKQVELLDKFAGQAMQALISKLPLFDQKGEFGEAPGEEKLNQIKQEITDSAYGYACHMLSSRTKALEWVQGNKAYFIENQNF